MEVSGKPNEGWMLIIPGTIFIVFVIAILGGPRAFLNTVSVWAADSAAWLVNFARSF